MDEILLARVLERNQVLQITYTDDEVADETAEEYLDDETEYSARKGPPVIL